MANFLSTLLIILLATLGIFGGAFVYNILNMSFLKKFRINKWIPLVLAILCFVLPIFLYGKIITFVVVFLQTFLTSFFLFAFLDLRGYREVKKKEIVIKPKAKPNRIKNNKDK